MLEKPPSFVRITFGIVLYRLYQKKLVFASLFRLQRSIVKRTNSIRWRNDGGVYKGFLKLTSEVFVTRLSG